MIIGIFCPSDRLDVLIKRLKLTGYRVMEYTAFSLAVLSNLDSFGDSDYARSASSCRPQ